MGEAKRRKMSDPNYGKLSTNMLALSVAEKTWGDKKLKMSPNERMLWLDNGILLGPIKITRLGGPNDRFAFCPSNQLDPSVIQKLEKYATRIMVAVKNNWEQKEWAMFTRKDYTPYDGVVMPFISYASPCEW